ncbi:MAG: Ig-like domain-containing protein [Gaiellaceae bacterium]
MGTRGDRGGAAGKRATLAAIIVALALPAPAHADQWVDVFEWGVSPPVIEVDAGEAVHFTNWSGLPTVVAADGGLFDSGPLGPGAGYSVLMTVPGSHSYATAGIPDLDARIEVVLRELDGELDALANDHIPRVQFAPVPDNDLEVHAELGVTVSKTRILVGFTPNATVGQANDALDGANVVIRGGSPSTGTLLVEVAGGDDGDEFDALEDALDDLREYDAVDFAAMSFAVEPLTIPAASDGPARTFPGGEWEWDLNPSSAAGGNWGLERSRVPQAWNLLEEVRRRDHRVIAGVVDAGYDSHLDLPTMSLEPVCGVDEPDSFCSGVVVHTHGTHVAGIIGADRDLPSPTEPGRTRGVAGVNPVAELRAVTARYEGHPWDGDWGETFQIFDFLLDEVEGGLPLRAINFSMGHNFSFESAADPNGHLRWPKQWWTQHPDPICGPGPDDDGEAGSTDYCTPSNEDTWIEETGHAARSTARVARRASELGVLIVQAAGNAGLIFCKPASGPATFLATLVDWTTGACFTATSTRVPVRGDEATHFGRTSRDWLGPLANPIVIVENIDSSLAAAPSTSFGGHVSAPGSDILSTYPANNYETATGTSMAAPFVTGLITYLLAFDPSLTVAQVREKLETWADNDVTGGAAPRVDAYDTLMSLPEAHKAMVDVNDPSKDGNRRVVLEDGNVEGELDVVRSSTFGNFTEPDGHVDMRDFRRFRDAYIDESVPEGLLNGPESHPKRDLNFDGCTYWGTDNDSCLATEATFARFDFNGNGDVGRFAESPVPTESGPVPMTDLRVLERQWDDDLARTEGWRAGDLARLFPESGDVEVHAEALFDVGASSVELAFRNPDTGETYPSRTLAAADDFLVATVPAGKLEITATATTSSETVASEASIELVPGEDERVDMCLQDLVLSAGRTTVPVGGTTPILATFDDCESGVLSGKPVTFSLLPIEPDGASLSPESGTTDAEGHATSTFSAGDLVGVYTVSVSLELGEDRTLEDELQIEVVPALKVAYVWRQEILDWSESGSSRWGPPIDPLMPDCVNAGVPYCIDSFTLAPAAPFNSLEREGVISGLGNALTLSEEVAPSPNSARQSWTLTDPDGASPRSDEAVVRWQVADDQLTRYTDFALPDTVRTRDDDEGIRLFGLRAVAGLGYQHDAAFVDPPAGTSPVELWFTTGRMLLQPRGDGSSLQYAPRTTVPILFPRNAEGDFEPYSYCQTIEYDLTSERGYWNPSTSEWVRGATDQGRKTTFTPGDRPMPVGPGILRVRYSFGAVAAYGADEPAAILPDCEETSPPDASFEVDGAFEEGRMQVFRSTSTDPENDIVSWQWNFGDGTVVDGVPNTFGLQAHLFKDDGFYEVGLTVTDSEGRSDTATRTVTVTNLPPEATFEDATGVEGLPIDVPFSVWDPSEEDSRALEIEITLEGLPTPLLSTTREAGFSTFRVNGLTEGTHTLTLRVEDDDGATATDTATVTVLPPGSEPPPPPPPGDPTPTCDPGVVLDAEEQLLLGLLNTYRAQNGLVPVGVSPTLTRAAERHANDMATNDNFSHTGTDESTPFERAMDAGYPGETVSENLFFGSPRAQDALLGWKSSTEGHNQNMLQLDWRAIGIARQFGSGKWFWATSFGDFLDCPGAGEEDVLESTVPAATREAPRALAAASPDEVAAEAVLLPYDPLPALTISNVNPRENQLVTIVNRSRDAAGTPIAGVLEHGDGELVELGPDESTEVRFAAFDQSVQMTATDGGGRQAEVQRQIWVQPLSPPTIQYTGETLGVTEKPFAVGARVLSPYDSSPVAGLEVTFELAGATASALTDADGVAEATLDLTGAAPGSQFMTIRTAATDDLAAGTTFPFITLLENHPPVAKPGGPYVTGEGATLLLDGGLSTDPDPGDGGLLTSSWDLDDDGAFDDAHGATPAELQWEEIRTTICGGLCATGTPYPIALQVTDRWRDSHSAATTVTFTADFGLVLGGGTITIVPGASNSVAVTVVGSTGWTEPVTLSVTGLPAGVTGTFSKNPVTPTDTSVLTLTAGETVENGTFPVRVSGTGGGITHETGEDVTVAFGLIPICFGSYTGVVTDVETGLPVENVLVRMFNISGGALTDVNGRYVLRNAPLGFNNAPRTHSVSTSHGNYWESAQAAQAVCRGVTRVDFAVLAKKTGRLTGEVVDKETRLPLSGARLTAFGGPTAVTGPDGRYALDLPLHPANQPRFYTYKAEATGYWDQSLSVTVDATTPQERNYELLRKCQGTIRGGTVRIRQTGAVVPSTTVRLQLSSFQFLSTTTNSEGRFSFDRLVDLGPGNTPIGYSVQAFPPPGAPPGSTSGFATFLLEECGDEASTDIEIGVPVENFGAIEGVVRDEETLEPIAGANLRACAIQCVETPSGPDGRYSFPKLHVGFDSQTAWSYTVQGSKAGYYTFSTPFNTVTANETTRVDIVLLRQKFGRLEGNVTDILSGAPIPEAAIQEPPFGCAFNTICAISDREGHYLDGAIPLGTRNASVLRAFTISASDYWSVTRTATFTADTTNVVDVQLLKECPAARVVGTVVNAETQAPINGALVQGGGRSTLTDPTGRFVLEGLRAGAGNNPTGVSITASASGFFSQTKDITIFCGATIVVDFGSRESSLGIILGKVTNADTSAPIEDVLVASEFGQTAFTDENGDYRFDRVPLGDLNTDRSWKVTAFPDGFKPQTKTVVAKANVEVRADFAFSVLGNATPVADGLTAAGNEDTDVVLELTGSDADDDPLTFHVMRYPAHGRLFGTAPDVFYRPDRDFNGVDTFEFVVNDGLANSARATVALDMQPVNDPPAGFQDLFETGVGVPLRISHADLLANDVDVDGDALTVSDVFAGSTFLVEPGDGFVLVTPPAGFESATHVFAFNYRVADPDGLDSFGSAFVKVTRTPLAPVCADTSFSTGVDEPLDASLTCTDGNGDALTYELVAGSPEGFLVFRDDGTFTFTPPPGFAGTTTFGFRATDGALTSAPATATIVVAPENTAPVAPDVSAATDEDTPVEIDLPATDADGDTLALAHGEPAHGSFDGTTYTPDVDFFGDDSFTYTADDGSAADEGVVTITVRPVNDAPEPVADAVSTDEDTAASGNVLANDVDPDGDTLSAALEDEPEHGNLTLAPEGDFSYTPDPNYAGPDEFTYASSDGVLSEIVSVRIDVRPVEDDPTAADDSFATGEDTALNGAVLANDTDPEAGALTATVVDEPAHGSLTLASDGTFTYSPDPNFHGTDSFSYDAVDPAGRSARATASILVHPVNDAPEAEDLAASTDEDVSLELALDGSDVEGDALSVEWTTPAHGSFDGSRYVPGADFNGTDTFMYTVRDPTGADASATVTIDVRPVNDSPVATDASVETDEDVPLTIGLAATDVDGDTPLAFQVDSGPAHGAYADGTYTPEANYHGPDTISFTVDDGHGGTDTGTVAIAVRPVNDAPVAEDQAVTTGEDVPVAIVLRASDVDGDALELSVATAPAHGTYAGGIYTPEPGYEGPDSFTFVASDGHGGSGTGTVRITVEAADEDPSNRPPVVELTGPAAIDEGAGPATYTASASDPDGDDLTYSWTGATGSGATATFGADDGPASHTITVTVDDGSETASASLTVTVRNVAPSVNAGPDLTGVWGLPLVFAGSASDPSAADTAAGLAGGWSFGDGGAGDGRSATHAYADPGPFLAVLTARDKDGGAGSDSAAVTIGKRPTGLAYTGSRSEAEEPAVGCEQDDDRLSDPLWLTMGSRGGDGRERRRCDGDRERGDGKRLISNRGRSSGPDPTGHAYGAVTLSARLSDVADPATARLAGREVRFQVGTLVFTATTDAAGDAVAQPQFPIPPGTYEIVVTFAGDTHYLPSETRAPLRVVSSSGKVTGGGLRSLDHPGHGGFNVHDGNRGQLQWRNGTVDFHAGKTTALGIAPDGRSAWFAGMGRDGSPFVAYVEDNGEPGREDVFELWIAGVPQTPGGGSLAGGNIQIHKG